MSQRTRAQAQAKATKSKRVPETKLDTVGHVVPLELKWKDIFVDIHVRDVKRADAEQQPPIDEPVGKDLSLKERCKPISEAISEPPKKRVRVLEPVGEDHPVPVDTQAWIKLRAPVLQISSGF